MIGPMHYAFTKLGHVVTILMTHPGDLRDRFARVEALGSPWPR
jgi:hypothetical protein